MTEPTKASLEQADKLRNSDCPHNTDGWEVACAADCNLCIALELDKAVRLGYAQGAGPGWGPITYDDPVC